MTKRSPEERFWAKVNKHGPIPEYRPELGPCWIWTGKPNSTGYGRLSIGGRPGQLIYAHRFAYNLLVGPIPEGLEPDHLCRVTLCVKAVADEHGPAHLEAVTRRVNTLRGQTIPAANAAKTHCAHGHELTEANLYRWPRHPQIRYCLTCRDNRETERQARRRHRKER